ncbi:hypothetical protein LshimejAT787_1200620 [Lyophyllum shimeji]|uniref:Extracellular membrane protein CFEM domain-containing protein n=1 Tax=Lyophyllum shimeji TaxID=47721 RepID=A0A9P3PV58_LYOSH|nr:hypothetical protein LshimejAT787_1200620 [Lyophyllum shimeji]
MLPSMFQFILPALVLVTHASAATLAPRSIHELLTRQSTFDPNTIPAQCRDTCGILISTVASCQSSTQPSCGCSATEERGFVNCLNCILGVGTPSQEVIDNTQAFVDQYVIVCNRAGVPLPATTIRGGVSEITSTLAPGASATNTAGRPTSGSLTRTVTPPTSVPVPQATFTGLDPTQTETGGAGAAPPSPSSGPSNPLAGLNSASRTRGRQTAGAAVAVAVVLVVFF